MIRSKMQVFIQLPEETSRRVLHAADVGSFDEGVVVVQLGCGAPTMASGDELLLYYETNREFMKYSARVLEVVEGSQDDEDVLELKLELIGQPVSAESRKCYRVVTALCGLTATIGEQCGCHLVDASVTGFAVIAKPGLKIGTNLRVTLQYEDASFSGNACLQSIKPLDAKRTRYGFSCSESGSSELACGLRTINLEVQRMQMQRLSRSA
ncbi:MAG: PilZ domain-containing protein [Planctomycetes bacterium]|nr:PilZ domain-containing protein [Planctomycetota bacterium]